MWQLPLRWIDEQIKGRSSDASGVYQPTDEDYKDFTKGGYQQDFRTGIDENLWSEETIKRSSPSKQEIDSKQSEDKEIIQPHQSKQITEKTSNNENRLPMLSANPLGGGSTTKAPTQSNKYGDDSDDDEDELMGWNK